jgi:hypothetical protein
VTDKHSATLNLLVKIPTIVLPEFVPNGKAAFHQLDEVSML